MRPFLTLVLFLALFAQSSTATHSDALVLEVKGHWILDHKPVAQGMGLTYGQTVRLESGAPAGRIVIWYPNGERHSCPDKDRPVCLDITVDRPVRKSTRVWERVFAVLEDAFNSDSRSVPGLTKSSSIPDGYAELRGTDLVIHSPGLPPEPAQRTYQLQFRRFKADNVLESPIQPSYNWRPGSSLTAGRIKPGLYRVNLLDADSRPSGDFFLLLVLDSSAAGHTGEDFEALVTATDAWGPQEQTTALVARRMFLWQSAKALGIQEAR